MKRSIHVIALVLAMLLMLCACGETYSDALRSQGLDQNGYIEGVKALDYVQLCDISSIPVKESDIQEFIDQVLATVPTRTQIMDRPVAKGEHVNISYTGYLDGVEFEGGSTGEGGTDIIVGETIFIDTFIRDLEGHMPGETFEIEETFPNYYPANVALQNKTATFKVTINYLFEEEAGPFTDEYIAENLSKTYGWNTCEEMKQGAIDNLAYVYLQTNSPISEIPQAVLQTQYNAMQAYYQTIAGYYNMTFEEVLKNVAGVSSMEELIKISTNYFNDTATQALINQAIAESEKLDKVTKKEMREYFKETTGYSDFSAFKEIYGLPYIKQITRNRKVSNLIRERVAIQ